MPEGGLSYASLIGETEVSGAYPFSRTKVLSIGETSVRFCQKALSLKGTFRHLHP